MYLLYPFTSILIFLGVSKNGSNHSFKNFLSLIFFLFNLTLCLWFDLHRHLFLLVLFLLCACDYNQEMEIQKSTCCHSKYVLFHLLTTLVLSIHTSHLCFVISPPSLHGFARRAALTSGLSLIFRVGDRSVGRKLSELLWVSFLGLMGVISELLPLL